MSASLFTHRARHRCTTNSFRTPCVHQSKLADLRFGIRWPSTATPAGSRQCPRKAEPVSVRGAVERTLANRG